MCVYACVFQVCLDLCVCVCVWQGFVCVVWLILCVVLEAWGLILSVRCVLWDCVSFWVVSVCHIVCECVWCDFDCDVP